MPKGERKREHESVAETATATDSIKLSVDDSRCRSTTSTIVNAPARNNRGIDKESQSPTTPVTGSLLQKPVTLSAANLGSCYKNPGKADSTIDTGAIFEKKGGSSKWFDPRGEGAKSSRGADRGGVRPAAGKHSKKWKKWKI
jgi:hypothetical protein